MNNETYLYAVNALGGVDDGGIFRASDFLAMEIASSSTVSLKFKAGVNTGKGNMITLADEVNGVYTLPFSGAVLVDDSL